MATARTIARLTEDWPEEAGNFELQAFAAAVHDGRTELSAPALERIETALHRELDRRTVRPEQPPTRWQLARRSVGSSLRMFMPYAAAASVLIGGAVWLQQRMAHPAAAPGTPVQMPVEHKPHQPPLAPDAPLVLPATPPQGS